MNNLTQAVEIAVSVRRYLAEVADISAAKAREAEEIQAKIMRQVKNISKLP